MKFGLSDYLAMYRKRGLKLPFFYFLENHLFDIVNRTETHTWLPKDHFTESPANFENGVLYMSSWTSIIQSATKFVLDSFSIEPADCAFVDIGCGKGKVMCVWRKMLPETASVIGIDYSQSLLSIAEQNLKRISAENYTLVQADASQVNFDFGKKINIFYMYNPFNEIVMEQVLENIRTHDSVIIYNNPVHGDLLLEKGYQQVKNQKTWHPNADYGVFSIINESRRAA